MSADKKTWVIRDTDGNLPTLEEEQQILAWFTRDDSHPVVRTKRQGPDINPDDRATRLEWSFEATKREETIAWAISTAAHHESLCEQYRQLFDATKAAVISKDLHRLRSLFEVY